jgi:putative hydrolase
MYPVDLHMHTVASTHAYSTLSDYIAEAVAKASSCLLLPIMDRTWRMRLTTGTLSICVFGHVL